jgi:hypothetical protein
VLSFIEPYMAENTFHEYRTDYPGNFFPWKLQGWLKSTASSFLSQKLQYLEQSSFSSPDLGTLCMLDHKNPRQLFLDLWCWVSAFFILWYLLSYEMGAEHVKLRTHSCFLLLFPNLNKQQFCIYVFYITSSSDFYLGPKTYFAFICQASIS